MKAPRRGGVSRGSIPQVGARVGVHWFMGCYPRSVLTAGHLVLFSVVMIAGAMYSLALTPIHGAELRSHCAGTEWQVVCVSPL